MKTKKKTARQLPPKSSQSGSSETGAVPNPENQNNDYSIHYLCLAVAIMTFVIYLPALRNGFVDWDDYNYVVNNPHLRSLDWDFFRWACVDYATNLWHPLTWISHAFDFAIWGTKPLGHHLTSIILHAVNTGVVIWLSSMILQYYSETRGGNSLTRQTVLISAGVTGILFGLHPIHVESVAWVAERKDLLYSFCYMMSIIVYLRFVHVVKITGQKNWYFNKFYGMSLGWFFLALCSKPMAVTLPLVLLILDWFPLERYRSGKDMPVLILEKTPFFALSGAVSIVTVMAQKAAGGLVALQHAPPTMRVLVALRALMLYLWNLIVPVNLLPFYPYPGDVTLGKPVYLTALLVVLTISAACCFVAKRQKTWLAVWGIVVVSLAPVLGIFQAGSQSMADRFMYLPSLGPFLIMGIGCAMFWVHAGKMEHYGTVTRRVFIVVVCAVSFFMAGLTVKQTGIWKNTLTLWEYNLKNMSDINAEAYYLRAGALIKDKQFDRALEDYSKAISLAPEYPIAYIERGGVYIEKGLYDRAIEDANKGISLGPGIANAYAIRGTAYFHKGDLAQALSDFNKALEINPEFVKAIIGRGDVYSSNGETDKAIVDYSMALDRIADLDIIYISRGDMYLKKGSRDLALLDYQAACKLGNFVGCVKSSLPQ